MPSRLSIPRAFHHAKRGCFRRRRTLISLSLDAAIEGSPCRGIPLVPLPQRSLLYPSQRSLRPGKTLGHMADHVLLDAQSKPRCWLMCLISSRNGHRDLQFCVLASCLLLFSSAAWPSNHSSWQMLTQIHSTLDQSTRSHTKDTSQQNSITT